MTTQFNWLSYLEVAQHLSAQQEQSFRRSAISRAYYGVFGHARDTLQGRGAAFSTGGDVHRQVISALPNDPRPEVAQLGKELDDLRKERNRADYQTRARFVASRVRGALAEARRIRDGIAVFFPSS